MNTHQIEAVAVADAHAHNCSMPLYSEMLSVVQRLARPDEGEMLTLDDYRQIARNLLQGATFDVEIQRQ
jgi:hypothetical protein